MRSYGFLSLRKPNTPNRMPTVTRTIITRLKEQKTTPTAYLSEEEGGEGRWYVCVYVNVCVCDGTCGRRRQRRDSSIARRVWPRGP